MPLPPIDRAQADRYLSLLGKEQATARLRAFPPRLHPDAKLIGARKGPYNLRTAGRWQQDGRGIYVVVNDGGDNDSAITACRALFLEWDTKPVDWQISAWQEFGLGEPTFIVATGGKSAHLYWVLAQPIAPARWIPLQAALISHTGADPTNRNPSRVLRLPGAHYLDTDGSPLAVTSIVAASGSRYTPEQIAAWLPSPATAAAAEPIFIDDSTGPTTDLPPRPPETLREALLQIPPFRHGAGQYGQLLGLAMRLHVDLGPDDAQQLLAETCCAAIRDLRSYFRGTPSQIAQGSTWPYLRDHWGVDISRRDLRDRTAPPPPPPHNSDRTAGASASASPGQQATPPLISLDDVRRHLHQAVADGVSRSDLEALRIDLANQSGINAATLRDLARSIQNEHESRLNIERESLAIQATSNHHATGGTIRLTDFLPPSLAQALTIRTRSLPADDVATLVTFTIGLSGLVKLGSVVVASEAADYRVPLNLYGALVARSGAKKSPLLKLLVEKPSEPLRIELARDHTRAMEQWIDDNRGVKPADRPDPPQAAYLSISDCTAEALARQLQTQESRGLGLLIHRDELAGMFGNLNAYRSGRGGDEEQLLEAYDGSPFRSLRVAAPGGGRFYSRCHLSIYGTIQPAILQRLVADGDASGLWARFLFIPLPERVVPLPQSETPEEQQQTQWAMNHLAIVARFIFCQPVQALALDPAARAVFTAFEANAQGMVFRSSLPAHGALWGKAGGKVLRLAGLLHLLHHACEDGHHQPLIGERAVEHAIKLVDHLNAWTLSLHQKAAEGGATELMRLIHRVARETSLPVTWRAIAGRLSKGQRSEVDSAAAAAAMEALASLGVGHVEKGPRGAPIYTAKSVDLP